MVCKNCGSTLAGMEHACPVCGFPVTSQPPHPLPSIPVEILPATSGNHPMTSMTPVAPTDVEEVVEEKGNNKTFAIILLVVALIAIIVGVVWSLSQGKKETPAPVEEERASNAVEYAGYEFSLPMNYTGEVKEGLGLYITDTSNNKYTINVDYTNTYASYKASYTADYPDQIEKIITTVANQEYLVTLVTDVDNTAAGAQYVTTSRETAAFVGFIIRNDFKEPTSNEMKDLNTIIDTATKVSEVEQGSSLDFGKDGIKVRQFVKADFE